jgi:Tetratricopeptide repeat/Cytochrome c554 and c-prime
MAACSLFASESKECAPCHARIYKDYLATPMARTSGEVRERTSSPVFSSADNSVHYQVQIPPDGTWFTFEQGEIKGRRRLDYFLGSGIVGRSYLTSVDGFLFQAPVAYYTSPAVWGLSPGYERANDLNLVREAQPGCLKCHASGLRTISGTSNGYSQPPLVEAGVSCDRCHGPGEEHISLIKSGRATKHPTVQRNVCSQCHLPGAVEISGIPFIWRGAESETTVNGHYEQFARSMCLRASSGKLWCGTCHQPHTLLTAAEKPAFYRKQCLSCHTVSTCKAPSVDRAKVSDSCTECHMPRRSAITVQHAAITDHTISRRPRLNSPADIPADAVLVPFDGSTPGDRELGLAYASVAIPSNNRTWGMRAFALLQKANAAAANDPKVLTQLAELYSRMGKEDEACRLFETAVTVDPNAVAALVNSGTCLARENRIDESIKRWQEAVKRSPGLESAQLNLAVALARKGDVAAARATLNEALRFNPASRKAIELLRDLKVE